MNIEAQRNRLLWQFYHTYFVEAKTSILPVRHACFTQFSEILFGIRTEPVITVYLVQVFFIVTIITLTQFFNKMEDENNMFCSNTITCKLWGCQIKYYPEPHWESFWFWYKHLNFRFGVMTESLIFEYP